jgi:DNA-binding beta-propeller fold protein YncE
MGADEDILASRSQQRYITANSSSFDNTDNISPNIVLSRDAKRGFVGYAGSGVVLAFSVPTGEVLARIQTSGKPSTAIPLPDGKTIAVTLVLDNQIFPIDMDSMSMIRGIGYNFLTIIKAFPLPAP